MFRAGIYKASALVLLTPYRVVVDLTGVTLVDDLRRK
jgi:hypothetical protein